MVKRWLMVNSLTIMIVLLWSVYQGFDSSLILVGKGIAQVAFVLILVNINMYFVFYIIRNSKVRKVKVRLAKLSKRMMKYHVAVGVTSTALLGAHVIIMLIAQTDGFWKVNIVSGVAAALSLVLVLFSGLLRRWKSSGFRRKFHVINAFVFLFLVLVHIFI